MFFNLFSKKPDMPEGWDYRHLWAAQVLLASMILSEFESYREITDEKAFLDRITKDLAEIMEVDDQMTVFKDEEIKIAVLTHLDGYIEAECGNMIQSLKNLTLDSLKPDKDAILQTLKDDMEFYGFIAQSGGPSPAS